MNSYTVAFGILGLGVFLAGLLWSIPVLRRRRQVRQFRRALTHIDTVALAWSHQLRQEDGPTDLPTSIQEDRHLRRRFRRDHPDDGTAAVA